MSNDSRVPAGVPTGGQFAASARGESTVSLAGAPDAASDTTQAVIEAAYDHLMDPAASHDLAGRMADAAPALARTGALREHAFKDQYLYPLVSAVHAGDQDEVQRLATLVADLEVAEQVYLDSDWAPAGVDITDRDNMYGALHTGSKYEPNMRLTDVTKAMRADIKDAQAAGYIPADLTYRVTKDGNSINITVEGMPDERRLWRNPHSEYKSPGANFHAQPSWEALRLRTRVESIGAAYAYSQSSGMHDYSSVSHYVFSTIQSEGDALWHAHEKEEAALKRRMKAKAGSMSTNVALREEWEQMKARHAAEMSAKREADREKWDW